MLSRLVALTVNVDRTYFCEGRCFLCWLKDKRHVRIVTSCPFIDIDYLCIILCFPEHRAKTRHLSHVIIVLQMRVVYCFAVCIITRNLFFQEDLALIG